MRPGHLVGGYRLVTPIGQGGFATVWHARHPVTNRSVAIKVLHPKHLIDPKPRGPSVKDRFLDEASILARLDAPGFVRVIEIVDASERGLVAYVMEHLRGEDLSTAAPKLGLRALFDVFIDAAHALNTLHEQGLVHRDVKPSNIFVCEPDELGRRDVKILDLGLAKDLIIEHHTATGMILGTLEYMAPETLIRLHGDPCAVTPAIDQWGLGASLYQCLTGRPPFSARTPWAQLAQILQAPLQPVDRVARFGNSPVPNGVERVLGRCLSKRPGDRYTSMLEVADELIRAKGELQRLEVGGETLQVIENEDPTLADPNEFLEAVDTTRNHAISPVSPVSPTVVAAQAAPRPACAKACHRRARTTPTAYRIELSAPKVPAHSPRMIRRPMSEPRPRQPSTFATFGLLVAVGAACLVLGVALGWWIPNVLG